MLQEKKTWLYRRKNMRAKSAAISFGKRRWNSSTASATGSKAVAARFCTPSPVWSRSRFFRAANLLTVDREKGLGELQALAGSGEAEVSARAKFALAQAREADGQ